uniref:CCT domain-containing protein n=1 Tax=Leersia perrieri TaxID=77586 RepID=A0A0D9WP26_9ORYZ
MSSAAKSAAGAVGAKAARACDGCLRRRARWYCAADDAFLCQGCDTSVHSANPLARRHERLRLRPSSPLIPSSAAAEATGGRRDEVVPAAWFKRKARTPRGGAKGVVGQMLSRRLVVPETMEERRVDEGEVVEEQQQLLYRVPIFDPALAPEFCSPPPPLEDASAAATATAESCCNEVVDGAVENPTKNPPPMQFFPDGNANFGPTDAELREFAADMEALLGRGLDDGNDEDSFCMETLGLIEPVELDDGGGRVKMEDDGDAAAGMPLTMAWCHDFDPTDTSSGEMLDIDFDCDDDSPHATTPDDSEKVGSSLALSLNYESIIESWGSSPWTDGGERPHVKLNDSWPHDYTPLQGVWMGGVFGHGGDQEQAVVTAARLAAGMDGGREARVSRYREKRRTRLFSKKIRYEVRKLNAEKRPRMKGRFVKRATSAAATVATACVA